MKINSNFKTNYFKYYNEALGVAANKKRIIKKHKVNKLNYYEQLFLVLSLVILICIILLLNDYFRASLIIFLLSTFALIINIITYLLRVRYEKSIDYQNTIIINEEGITDNYLDIIITFTWKRIKALVIKKNTIVILTDTYIYFYFDIKDKDKVLKAIKSYKKELLIIE